MLIKRRSMLLGMIASTALAIGAAPTAKRPGLPDPLDVVTTPSDFARRGAVSGIARHGDQLIAVGPRGLILVSTDAAKTWSQATSPVGTDLVTVKFQDANTAWAVGHDAVALRTSDGGASWQKVLDGRLVLALLRDNYAVRIKAGDPAAEKLLTEVDRAMEQSATPNVLPSPFLDVWFADANEGYLVGAFGLVLRTQDGGKQWEPIIDKTDNDRRFHMYAVTGNAAERYIAGEQGLLLRWDAAVSQFVKVETPYAGTFFGMDVQGTRVVVFGLRGNVYIRTNITQAWTKLETGTDANIVAAVNLADDQLVLAAQNGQLLWVQPDTQSVKAFKIPVMGEFLSAVASGPKSISVAGLSGVSTMEVDGLMAALQPSAAPLAKK